jgi:hypothetical protein
VALLALVCALLPMATHAEDEVNPDPLTLTIDSMSPPTSDGDVQLSGRITNVDTQTWHDIQIIPCLSDSPIQTTSALADAVKAPSNAVVCKRKPAVFTKIDQLDTGTTTTWTLTVPRSVLPHIHGGVYWFGVHALGTSDAGVSVNADGRARTFLPLVGQTNSPARVHLVVEITEPIAYDDQGHLMERVSNASGAPRWADEFSGHLSHLLSVVNRTPGADLLVDPAVLDAATKLADGNPGWLGNAAARADTKTAAQNWLNAFKAVGKAHQVWALPYGDVDLNATADRPDITVAAEAAALAPFRAAGVAAAPARRAPDFSASTAVVNGSPGTTAFVDARTGGSVSYAGEVRVVGTAIASLGGPHPGAPYAPVALRQTILAEAALHVGTTSPVVAVIPSAFDTSDPAGFVDSLSQPWVTLMSLPQALEGRTSSTFPDQQPPTGGETPLVQLSVEAYDAAATSTATLNAVTSNKLDVAGPIRRSAFTALSPANIHGPAAQELAASVATMVRSVRVTAPPGVTLSGSSGRFSLTLNNPLPVPVKVTLRVVADSDTKVDLQTNQVVPANGSVSTLANVSLDTHGNHRVSVEVLDSANNPTGESVEVTIRSVQVSGVIWAFILGGCGLLGVAIVTRLLRRLRNRP